jgi:5'-phosphate synthase pdxT subunit
MSSAPIGLLAMQGDFPSHARELQRRGRAIREVRRAGHLQGLQGLVLPGGESSTMLKLLALQELTPALLAAIDAGLPVLATCAGLILLADRVSHPAQHSLQRLRVAVQRNAYGRQIASGVFPLRGAGGFPSCAGVFIRAPRISSVGTGVEVLAWRGDDPVLVRQGSILAATFHPEMHPDHPALDWWLATMPVAPPVSRPVTLQPAQRQDR